METLIDFFLSPYQNSSSLFISLEIIAVICGIGSVLLAQRNKIWVYPIGLISTCIYGYITWEIGYYGDFTINVYYTAMSLYGWLLWANPSGQRALPISYANKKDWRMTGLLFFGSGLFITCIYLYFDKFLDWKNYVDVLTTALAFGSMWLMAKKKIENWIGWIITDLISVPLYFAKGLGFSGIQFSIFCWLAFVGYKKWVKLQKERQ